jgi:hypothetical protein
MTSPGSTSNGGSLVGGLFLVTAACSVMLAMVAPVWSAPGGQIEDTVSALIAAIVGGFVLGLLGLLVGMFQFRILSGMFWGCLVGAVIGAFTGPLIFLPIDRLSWLLGTAICGSVILLISAAVIGIRSRRLTANRDTDHEIVVAEAVNTQQQPRRDQ